MPDSIFTTAPPLATSPEQTQLRQLDAKLAELREEQARLRSVRGGSREAAKETFGKEFTSTSRFDQRRTARERQREVQRELEFLERQRREIQQAAESRVLARGMAQVRQLPPADQEQITALTNSPEAQQQAQAGLDALSQQMLEQAQAGDPDVINTAVQLRSMAEILDKSTPAGIQAEFKGEPGPATAGVQRIIRSIIPRTMQATTESSFVEPEPGTATFMSPTLGVPGGEPLPEGFSRAPVETRFGVSNELRAPEGQQLFLRGGPEGVGFDVVPRGGPVAPALAGSPQFSIATSQNPQAPAAAIAPPPMPEAPIGEVMGPPAPIRTPGGLNTGGFAGLGSAMDIARPVTPPATTVASPMGMDVQTAARQRIRSLAANGLSAAEIRSVISREFPELGLF